MNRDYVIEFETSEADQLGIYGLVKKLSEGFADELPQTAKKRLLSKSYQILLKKGEVINEGLPLGWTDDDVLNSIKIEIFKRCTIKQNWTDKLRERVLKYFETLKMYKETTYYKNSISPTLRMLLCIEYYQNKMPTKQKETSLWFNADIISSYLENLKDYLPNEDSCSLISKKYYGISQSRSEGELTFFARDKKFDYVFQLGKPSNDLDEGFVTPNDEHIERTPCMEPRYSLPNLVEAKARFYWDPAIVTIPPSKYKTWEKYGTIGNLSNHKPFNQNRVLMHDWLRSAPANMLKISKEQLLDNLIVLCVGIPSSIFFINEEHFFLKDGIYTDDLIPATVADISKKFIKAGEGFRALANFSEGQPDQRNEDAISQGFKISLRDYLYKYQTAIICAKESLKLQETSYCKFISTLEPFIDQVIYLKSILIQDEELKGVNLLKFLFDLMGSSSNTSIFYILSSLFLLPCTYYFRLIDDWIFNGKWHKDLHLSPCDMSNVNDRTSWVAAHKASSPSSWLIPSQSLAHCGKAIWLLSSSKKSGKLLSLLKSKNRPTLKVCLNSEELRVLTEQCEAYYSEGKEALVEEKEELMDLALCAQIAALANTETFESRKMENKLKEIEKKKNELILREQDLARSAYNKAMKKQEEDTENSRISKELEEIRLKEQKQETEKAKLILERYQEHFELEEKRIKLADWKIKRLALNEKRKMFLLKEINDLSTIMPINENIVFSLDNISPFEESEKKDFSKPSITPPYVNHESVTVNNGEVELSKSFSITNDCNKNTVEALQCSDSVYLNGNMAYSELERETAAQCQAEENAKRNEVINSPIQGKTSELERNKMKVLSSSILNDIQNMNILKYDNKIKAYNSILLENKNKILIRHFDNRDSTNLTNHAIGNINGIEGDHEVHNKLSDLEKNRNLILGSDFGRVIQNKIHIWDEANQRNRRNMLDSHISFEYEPCLNKVDLKTVDDNAREILSESENLIISNEVSPGKSSRPNKENDTFEESFTKDSEKIAVDTQDCDEAKNHSDLDIPEEFLSKKPVWFKKGKLNESEKLKHIFEFKSPSFIQDGDLDFTLLNKFVPQSLSLVIETQAKLMNEALMKMFLDEFEFLKVAQKLRQYFFLHGEFGKRLTSSLSKAIGNEQPSSLLTFYRLRSILADASKGDVKEVSFIVNDIPIAFDHTNPQTLSCLGMSYKFDWPLNLIFTDKAISKYNSVFVYLFSLQRVSWHLERVCHVLHFKPADLKGDQYTKIQLYRYVMSQFVGAIQSYIVTTVIENSWQEFVADIAGLKDIDELYRRHAIYINSIHFKCFLDERSKRLMVQIEKLLHYILVFCQTLLFGLWSVDENNVYSHTKFQKLRSTFESFLSHARYVTKVVKKLVQVNYQKNLENLYYYLTINSFYIS